MAYKKAADGVTKRGKTSAQVFPNSGPDVTPKTEGKGGKDNWMNNEMKSVGRNMARINNQKRGG